MHAYQIFFFQFMPWLFINLAESFKEFLDFESLQLLFLYGSMF